MLILASGSITHNLREIGRYAADITPPAWASNFVEWLTAQVAIGDTDALINYRHWLPLPTAIIHLQTICCHFL